MPTPDNEKLVAELIESLRSATSMLNSLLKDVKDHETAMTLVQVKMESLNSTIDTLSHIVRDGNGEGSLITRIVVLEKSVENIEEDFDDLKEELNNAVKDLRACIEKEKETEEEKEKSERAYKREKLLTKLKVAAVVAPGVIALLILLAKALVGDEISIP